MNRAELTERTVARYAGRKFSWARGVTCLHALHSHLVTMGHTPPDLPRLQGPLDARRALRAHGWGNTEDMLAELLPRIPYASARVGDVAVLESADGMGAIVICAGAKWFGWHDDADGFVPLVPLDIRSAYRV